MVSKDVQKWGDLDDLAIYSTTLDGFEHRQLDFGWKIKDVVDLVEEMSPSFTLPGVLDEVLNVMDSHKTHGGVQNVALFLLRTILKDWAANVGPLIH